MRFAERRRRNLWSSLRWAGILVLVAGSLLAVTAGPLLLGWWDVAFPAAIATGVAAIIGFALVVSLPLEALAYVTLYFERDPYTMPSPPRGFGRALYRQARRLDAMAREAGLSPLSDFESADPLETKAQPDWYAPEAALPTVEHLLARVEPRLKAHLEYLRAALREAAQRGGRFYFLVLTCAGATNSRIEAARHGDLSGISPAPTRLAPP